MYSTAFDDGCLPTCSRFASPVMRIFALDWTPVACRLLGGRCSNIPQVRLVSWKLFCLNYPVPQPKKLNKICTPVRALHLLAILQLISALGLLFWGVGRGAVRFIDREDWLNQVFFSPDCRPKLAVKEITSVQTSRPFTTEADSFLWFLPCSLAVCWVGVWWLRCRIIFHWCSLLCEVA